MKRKVLLAAIACLVLAGCGQENDPGGAWQGIDRFDSYARTIVIDGTTCVVVDLPYGGGVDCDFGGGE